MTAPKKNPGKKPPRAGMGRPKGIANKITRELKSMILGALDDVGGQAYLAQQAQASPAAFMVLVGKVLPLTLAGDPDAPVEIVTKVEYVVVDPPKRD